MSCKSDVDGMMYGVSDLFCLQPLYNMTAFPLKEH